MEMVKFEHTLFALPFAYTGAFLAGGGHLSFWKFIWITMAMITARTAGMSLNRLIDKDLDALNPRTASRALPKGLIPTKTVWGLVAVSLAVFLFSTAMLNKLSLFLSPLAILVLFAYSYLKRYTWLCHLGLGLVLACAPVGGWIAVAGRLGLVPVTLGAAVIFWLAGFDILYACLDVEFDRQFGLFSVPQHFGVTRALWFSAVCHILTFGFLALTGVLAGLSWPYDVGLLLVGILLVYEHAVVSPDDLTRMNQAFFQANAIISFLILASTLSALWVTS